MESHGVNNSGPSKKDWDDLDDFTRLQILVAELKEDVAALNSQLTPDVIKSQDPKQIEAFRQEIKYYQDQLEKITNYFFASEEELKKPQVQQRAIDTLLPFQERVFDLHIRMAEAFQKPSNAEFFRNDREAQVQYAKDARSKYEKEEEEVESLIVKTEETLARENAAMLVERFEKLKNRIAEAEKDPLFAKNKVLALIKDPLVSTSLFKKEEHPSIEGFMEQATVSDQQILKSGKQIKWMLDTVIALEKALIAEDIRVHDLYTAEKKNMLDSRNKIFGASTKPKTFNFTFKKKKTEDKKKDNDGEVSQELRDTNEERREQRTVEEEAEQNETEKNKQIEQQEKLIHEKILEKHAHSFATSPNLLQIQEDIRQIGVTKKTYQDPLAREMDQVLVRVTNLEKQINAQIEEKKQRADDPLNKLMLKTLDDARQYKTNNEDSLDQDKIDTFNAMIDEIEDFYTEDYPDREEAAGMLKEKLTNILRVEQDLAKMKVPNAPLKASGGKKEEPKKPSYSTNDTLEDKVKNNQRLAAEVETRRAMEEKAKQTKKKEEITRLLAWDEELKNKEASLEKEIKSRGTITPAIESKRSKLERERRDWIFHRKRIIDTYKIQLKPEELQPPVQPVVQPVVKVDKPEDEDKKKAQELLSEIERGRVKQEAVARSLVEKEKLLGQQADSLNKQTKTLKDKEELLKKTQNDLEKERQKNQDALSKDQQKLKEQQKKSLDEIERQKASLQVGLDKIDQKREALKREEQELEQQKQLNNTFAKELGEKHKQLMEVEGQLQKAQLEADNQDYLFLKAQLNETEQALIEKDKEIQQLKEQQKKQEDKPKATADKDKKADQPKGRRFPLRKGPIKFSSAAKDELHQKGEAAKKKQIADDSEPETNEPPKRRKKQLPPKFKKKVGKPSTSEGENLSEPESNDGPKKKRLLEKRSKRKSDEEDANASSAEENDKINRKGKRDHDDSDDDFKDKKSRNKLDRDQDEFSDLDASDDEEEVEELDASDDEEEVEEAVPLTTRDDKKAIARYVDQQFGKFEQAARIGQEMLSGSSQATDKDNLQFKSRAEHGAKICRDALRRLEIYVKFVHSDQNVGPYRVQQTHLAEANNLIRELNRNLRQYERNENIGFYGAKARIITPLDGETLDKAIERVQKRKVNAAQLIMNSDTGEKPTHDNEFIPGHGHTRRFDGVNNARRILDPIIPTQDPNPKMTTRITGLFKGKRPDSILFDTIQKQSPNGHGQTTFTSTTTFDPKQMKHMSDNDFVVLAAKMVLNHHLANPDASSPLRLVGPYPLKLKQYIKMFCDEKDITCCPIIDKKGNAWEPLQQDKDLFLAKVDANKSRIYGDLHTSMLSEAKTSKVLDVTGIGKTDHALADEARKAYRPHKG